MSKFNRDMKSVPFQEELLVQYLHFDSVEPCDADEDDITHAKAVGDTLHKLAFLDWKEDGNHVWTSYEGLKYLDGDNPPDFYNELVVGWMRTSDLYKQ